MVHCGDPKMAQIDFSRLIVCIETHLISHGSEIATRVKENRSFTSVHLWVSAQVLGLLNWSVTDYSFNSQPKQFQYFACNFVLCKQFGLWFFFEKNAIHIKINSKCSYSSLFVFGSASDRTYSESGLVYGLGSEDPFTVQTDSPDARF